MKQFMLLAITTYMLVACQKEVVRPKEISATIPPSTNLEYSNFNEREVEFNQGFSADLDHDGIADFFAYTMYVGDPILWRDYKKFLFGTPVGTDFPITLNEEVPMLAKGSIVSADAFPGYIWNDIAAITIAQKVITTTQNYWEGRWVNASHKFLPLRRKREGRWYYGWVEVSFNTQNEKLILHRAAICKEPDRYIKAGE